MCGIALTVMVDPHNVARNALMDQQGATTNLERRGPDHLSHVPLVYQEHVVDLKASVLKMRSEAILQPVTIDHGEEDLIYFCWNGEAYQIFSQQKTAKSHPTEEAVLETVASYDMADTAIVANLLQEGIRRQRTGGVDIRSSMSQTLASVFGLLVNAEYAFCLVTPWAIYYGRDPLGRRSLLHWGEEDANSPSTSQSKTCWKLTSVREDKGHQVPSNLAYSTELQPSMTESQAAPKNNTSWTEVAPGFVHEYAFATQIVTSTGITAAAHTLLDRHSPISQIDMSPPPEGVSTSLWEASIRLEDLLRHAVQLRLSSSEPKAAVLFSGGVDSVVLAALALQVLPPQETLILWNVSFTDDHQESASRDSPSNSASADCRAAYASYIELQQLYPDRKIMLETTQVSWKEMQQFEEHIRALIHPKTTTMDLNIGMALWFASRTRHDATGDDDIMDATVRTSSSEIPRILLVGMGADEQMGGYGRHRKSFERNGGSGLRQELDLDIGRLWERNLGRDDRIFSDHGKEARFPYLDALVVNFLSQLPLEDICDFSLPPGQGDKRILRLLAARMGLKTASGMVKRAIQFGSRISHVSDKRRFGSRRKAKGTAHA